MTYLTLKEFKDLGHDEVADFDKLLKRAADAVDLYTNRFYQTTDFATDFEQRKEAVRRAVAYQIAYLDSSGTMTAEDKQTFANISLGRTTVSYKGDSTAVTKASRCNLSVDAENWLRRAGFGFSGVYLYDR